MDRQLTIMQSSSVPCALNLRNAIDGTPILNPGSPARAMLQVEMPDGTTRLWTNLPRQTVATTGGVLLGETITVTLNTLGGGTPVGPLSYSASAGATAEQIAAGLLALINGSLPDNWLAIADGPDMVFSAPESGDSVDFNVTSAAHITITELGIFPVVTWVEAQLQFQPPVGCFAVAGDGTWNGIIDQNGDHIVTFTAPFRVIAIGSFAY